jgi:Transposase DDE domain/Domain of unknown function (DUF4372)
VSHHNTIFNQLLHLIPRHQFDRLVVEHCGDRYVKSFTCWQQFMTLMYAQLRGKDSLRDIETSLKAQSARWYHIGLTSVKRSTLADANNARDYRVYEGLFYRLLERCQSITPRHKFRFKNPLLSLDATLIDLCLSVFPWARFTRTKGALKMHALLDHSGMLPSFVTITDARRHEVKVARETALPLIPDSILSVDRGYTDYKWLYSLENSGVFFVTRTRKNMRYRVTGQHATTKGKGIISDEIVMLEGTSKSGDYPRELRLVVFQDSETGKMLTFLTNNFKLAASTITAIYKSRWQIELFFKWIKQNLKIKSFLGTSKNAVMTQVWVAMCAYLLLCYIKYQTKYGYSLLELTRMISETVFERISLIDLLSCKYETLWAARGPDLQPMLF